jgi:hypothetical protein
VTPFAVWMIILAAGIFIVGLVSALALRLRGHPQAASIVGTVSTIVAAMISLAQLGVALAPPWNGPSLSSSSNGAPTSTAPYTGRASDQSSSPPGGDAPPGVTTLPVDSPLKESGIPNMDQVCGALGYQPDAWVPGQAVSREIGGRVLRAPDQAYKWTCGSATGPTITRDQITAGCQIWKPGSAAFTWDRNYAYSWICA